MKVLYLTLTITILDQVTKLLVKGFNFFGFRYEGMDYGSSKSVIGNFFRITFIENPGMAFGIELGGKLTLSLFTIAATILILYFIYINKNESLYLRVALAFILGGAVGNLIDRIFYGVFYGYAPLFYGRVVDFFHFDVPDFKIFGKVFYSWPIFNIADIAVSVGFLMIILGFRKVFKKEVKSEYKAGISENYQTESPDDIKKNTISTENSDNL